MIHTYVEIQKSELIVRSQKNKPIILLIKEMMHFHKFIAKL